MATFTTTHPTVVAGITEYFQHGRTVDDLFCECLDMIIEGVPMKFGRVTESVDDAGVR